MRTRLKVKWFYLILVTRLYSRGWYGRLEVLRAKRTACGIGADARPEALVLAEVTGRRRIGKTTLIQRAMQELNSSQPVFYVQIPDSEPTGVLSAVNDALETFHVPADQHPRPNDLLQLAKLLESMAEGGFILILDEFRYFNRKGYEQFCSYLQASVDRLGAKADQVRGGLIVLGSIHTEMVALLEDRTAPLYNRVTERSTLRISTSARLCPSSEIMRSRARGACCFFGTSSRGVPKFYRDCYEQNVLAADRKTLPSNFL